MAGESDFFLRFDSNAEAFSKKLGADIAPGIAEINNLSKALTEYDAAAKGGGTNPLGGLNTALDGVTSKLDSVSTQLAEQFTKIVTSIGTLSADLQSALDAVIQGAAKTRDATTKTGRTARGARTERKEEPTPRERPAPTVTPSRTTPPPPVTNPFAVPPTTVTPPRTTPTTRPSTTPFAPVPPPPVTAPAPAPLIPRTQERYDTLSRAYQDRINRTMGVQAYLAGEPMGAARGHAATPAAQVAQAAQAALTASIKNPGAFSAVVAANQRPQAPLTPVFSGQQSMDPSIGGGPKLPANVRQAIIKILQEAETNASAAPGKGAATVQFSNRESVTPPVAPATTPAQERAAAIPPSAELTALMGTLEQTARESILAARTSLHQPGGPAAPETRAALLGQAGKDFQNDPLYKILGTSGKQQATFRDLVGLPADVASRQEVRGILDRNAGSATRLNVMDQLNAGAGGATKAQQAVALRAAAEDEVAERTARNSAQTFGTRINQDVLQGDVTDPQGIADRAHQTALSRQQLAQDNVMRLALHGTSEAEKAAGIKPWPQWMHVQAANSLSDANSRVLATAKAASVAGNGVSREAANLMQLSVLRDATAKEALVAETAFKLAVAQAKYAEILTRGTTAEGLRAGEKPASLNEKGMQAARVSAAQRSYDNAVAAQAKTPASKGGSGADPTWNQQMFGQAGFGAGQVRHIGLGIENIVGYSLVFTGFEKLKELAQTGLEAQAAFARLQASLTLNGIAADGLQQKFAYISSTTATPLQHVIQAAAELSGTLRTAGDLTFGVKIAAQLSNISQGTLTVTEAAVGLRDVVAAYGDQWANTGVSVQKGLQQTGDDIAHLSQLTGVNVKDITEGTTQIASEARDFGLTQRQASTIAAYVTQGTGEKGAAAATQSARLLATMNSTKTQEALQRVLTPPAGTTIQQQFATGHIGDVLTELIAQYGSLNPLSRAFIANLMGTGQQAKAFAALVGGGANAVKAMNGQFSDFGALAAQNQTYLQTIAGMIKQADEDFQNLGSTLQRIGAFDALGGLAKGLDQILKLINWIGGGISNLFGKTAVSNDIMHMTVTVLELAAAWKLLGSFATTKILATGIGQRLIGGVAATNAEAIAAGEAGAISARYGIRGVGGALATNARGFFGTGNMTDVKTGLATTQAETAEQVAIKETTAQLAVLDDALKVTTDSVATLGAAAQAAAIGEEEVAVASGSAAASGVLGGARGILRDPFTGLPVSAGAAGVGAAEGAAGGAVAGGAGALGVAEASILPVAASRGKLFSRFRRTPTPTPARAPLEPLTPNVPLGETASTGFVDPFTGKAVDPFAGGVPTAAEVAAGTSTTTAAGTALVGGETAAVVGNTISKVPKAPLVSAAGLGGAAATGGLIVGAIAGYEVLKGAQHDAARQSAADAAIQAGSTDAAAYAATQDRGVGTKGIGSLASMNGMAGFRNWYTSGPLGTSMPGMLGNAALHTLQAPFAPFGGNGNFFGGPTGVSQKSTDQYMQLMNHIVGGFAPGSVGAANVLKDQAGGKTADTSIKGSLAGKNTAQAVTDWETAQLKYIEDNKTAIEKAGGNDKNSQAQIAYNINQLENNVKSAAANRLAAMSGLNKIDMLNAQQVTDLNSALGTVTSLDYKSLSTNPEAVRNLLQSGTIPIGSAGYQDLLAATQPGPAAGTYGLNAQTGKEGYYNAKGQWVNSKQPVVNSSSATPAAPLQTIAAPGLLVDDQSRMKLLAAGYQKNIDAENALLATIGTPNAATAASVTAVQQQLQTSLQAKQALEQQILNNPIQVAASAAAAAIALGGTPGVNTMMSTGVPATSNVNVPQTVTTVAPQAIGPGHVVDVNSPEGQAAIAAGSVPSYAPGFVKTLAPQPVGPGHIVPVNSVVGRAAIGMGSAPIYGPGVMVMSGGTAVPADSAQGAAAIAAGQVPYTPGAAASFTGQVGLKTGDAAAAGYLKTALAAVQKDQASLSQSNPKWWTDATQILQYQTQIAQLLNNPAAQSIALQASQATDAVTKANLAVTAARQQLATDLQGGATSTQINADQVAINQGAIASRQASQAVVSAGYQLAVAQNRNAVGKAQVQLNAALQAEAVYRGGGLADAASLLAAQAQEVQARQAISDATEAAAEAQRNVTSAIQKSLQGDVVGAATTDLGTAQMALRYAIAQFGQNSAQAAAAQVTVINDQAALNADITARLTSALDLQIAQLTARGKAGDIPAAAALGVQKARIALSQYTARGGKTGTAESNKLIGDLATAQRASFDSALQAQLDTLSFQKSTYQITSALEIKSLQQILANKQLTLAEQRSITLQIKTTQDSMRQALTQGGLNIPSGITLPSVYQVRRSMGAGFSASTTHPVTNNNQQTSVTITQTLPNSAVATAIANQVVSIINAQQGSQFRATSSTPRLVPA